jgi:phosphatidylserine decarboxylase
MYTVTRARIRWWKNAFIRWFIGQYKVDISQAQITDPQQFENFNAFFTRALKQDARPLGGDQNSLVSPVDGTISQFGKILKGDVFQAKGRSYNLHELLAGEQAWIDRFSEGQFMTIYLSPKDYHRIHMPVDGTLTATKYVPGRLFSVSPATTRVVPRLFARNERLICAYDTPVGSILLIMVGALFVAGIETVWSGAVTPPHGKALRHTDFPNKSDSLKFTKGSEMGRFNMGSTVILLFEPNSICWTEKLGAGQSIQMGNEIASKIIH